MPLWVSMKWVKSLNQLLFHTMIKLYRQFQLGIVCADVWYRWFNYLNLTNSDLFQTYTKLDRSNVHQTNAKLTHWPNSKKIAKMWPNLRPTNFFILGLLYSWKIHIFKEHGITKPCWERKIRCFWWCFVLQTRQAIHLKVTIPKKIKRYVD